jgi:hypothetical protein
MFIHLKISKIIDYSSLHSVTLGYHHYSSRFVY